MAPFLWNGKASPYGYGDALVLAVTSTFWSSSPGPTYRCDGYTCRLSSGEFGISIECMPRGEVRGEARLWDSLHGWLRGSYTGWASGPVSTLI